MREHEQACFSRQTGLPREAFRVVNMAAEVFDARALDGAGAVMVGGSGDYSVAQGGFEWHAPMLELLLEVVRRGVPTLASCFGHQALAQALGGRVETVPAQAEVGTFEVRLTAAGRADPLFGTLPGRFEAQLGHKDAVVAPPPGAVVLAESERCAVQAMRLPGLPITTTQFHPELDEASNLERFLTYLDGYKRPDETLAEAEARARAACRPSPHACSLLRRFVTTLQPRPELAG